MREVTIFWGCTIPTRLVFVEKATRLVLAKLGVSVIDPPGFTCCPESQLVKTVSEHDFYLTAARNLSVAAETGAPLLTPCSGCYSTFRQTLAYLKTNWRAARYIEEVLAETGRRLDLSLTVWHFAEWLCDEIGPMALRRQAIKPLSGMKLAVHYGCHLLRPNPAVRWDSPVAPTKLEELLRALGAQVIDYDSKMLCCGSSLERAGQRESSHRLLDTKLGELQRLGVDGLVVACPACFLQFDLNQTRGKPGSQDSVPVFYIAEMVALALGYEPTEIGLDLHRTSVTPFLLEWQRHLEAHRDLAENFDLAILETCAACRACDQDCPLTLAEPGFHPSEVVRRLLSGEIEEVLAGSDPWRCLDCMTCLEKCHSRFGLAWIFERLRHLATRKGNAPGPLRLGYQNFVSKGILGTPRPQVREKLGLPTLPPNGAIEIARILNSQAGRKELTRQ